MHVTENVRNALSRLDAVSDLGAVAFRDDAAVLAKAEDLDLDPDAANGDLYGVAVTIKDWIDVTSFPCEGESAAPTGRVPARDATVVARLRAAGAVVVAKTQPGTDHPIHGRCHHPIDATRSPGGSSSGEAALIGAGASGLGLGSDSGGSIRLPAAWCGVVGLKPSFGLVPITGHFPRVGGRHDGRTVIGPLASSVDDVALALRIISGPDGVDPDCVPLPVGDPARVAIEELRIAVLHDDDQMAAPSTRAAVDAAVSVLAGLGATIVVDGLPPHLAESLDITERYWQRATGAPLTGFQVDHQLRDWDRFSGRLTRATARFDAVIGPVVADIAPLARPLAGEDFLFTLPWSLTGWPAISLPAGSDPVTGLPLAVQIAAPRWRDDVVLAIARQLENVGQQWRTLAEHR